jgi:phage protein D
MGVNMEFKPDFTLKAEGEDITAAIRRGLVSLTLTDYGGGTGNTDELQVTLMSETLKLPAKGVRLDVALGFKGQLRNNGSFVACAVESSGPPRMVTFTATAAPMNGDRHGGNVSNQKSRSFDDVTLGDIVTTVARDNGLKPRIASALTAIKPGHIIQNRESDAALLLRLARLYNAVSKPSGGYWLFVEQGKSATPSGASLPEQTIILSEVSRWQYSEGEKGGAGKKEGDKKKGDVRINYLDPETGETKTVTVEHDGKDTSHPYTQSSKEKAEAAGKSKAAGTARNSRKMSITMPCRPYQIALTAESKITTQGFGEKEDRPWLVESLKYSLGSNGMTLDVSLVASFEGKGGKKGKENSAVLDVT